MWKYIKQYLHFAMIAAAFMVGEVLMDLIQPGIMSQIVDDGVLGLNNGGVGDLQLIWKLGIQMIGLVLFGGLCGSLNNVFVHMTGQNIGNEIRKDCFRNIMTFSFPQMDRFGSGSIVTRVTNDITQVQNFVSQFVRGMIRTSMLMFGSMFFMFRLNHEFGLIILCAFPIIVGCLAFCLAKANPLFSKLQKQLDAINAIMQEDVSGIRIIKACVREIYEKVRFGKANDDLIKTQLQVLVIFAFMNPIINALMYLVVVLDEENEDNAGEPLAEEDTATVTFRNMNFSYVPGHPVIRDFNLTVPSGKKVALVGSTGSGKTTVVNLLMRFYDIDSGEILVNQQNIANVSRTTLRQNIAIVLQDTVLFSNTVRNNLKYANDGVTQEQLEKAVEMSRCKEMIASLPQGYDTMLTGSGENISQGQRQLLAIARAFVADPKILILDEATSNVDTRTEKAIQNAMQKIMENRTSIVIAHRLSTIRDADLIVVMDQGRIVEQGNHEQLLAQKGKYYELYMTQYAGFAT